MRYLVTKFSRGQLALGVSILSLIATAILMYGGYSLMGVEIRRAEVVIGTVAPLTIAGAVGWVLFGLLKRLDKLEREVRLSATYDPLTGVLSRQAFFERISSPRYKYPKAYAYCVMMVDLDHFKKINDTLGHMAGDAVLSRFGDALQSKISPDLKVARFGGEEFIVLCPVLNPDSVEQAATQLVKTARNLKTRFDDQPVHLTTSVGISSLQNDLSLLDQMVNEADQALYAAKANGRDQFCYFDGH